MAYFLYQILNKPENWALSVSGMVLLVLFCVSFMNEWKVNKAEFWGLLFPIVVFTAGALGFLFFLEQSFLRYLTMAAMVLLFALYLENLFIYRFQKHKYTQFSLPNLSIFLLTVAGFFLFSTGFGFALTNVLPPADLTWFALIYSFLVMWHLVWSYQIPKGKRLAAIFLVTLLSTELVWVLHFWPTTFFVGGLIVAVFLYAVPSLVQLALREVLTKKLWMQYAVISLLAVLFVTLTASWS